MKLILRFFLLIILQGFFSHLSYSQSLFTENSFKGINKLGIIVRGIPVPLYDLGIDEAVILRLVREKFERSGIDISYTNSREMFALSQSGNLTPDIYVIVDYVDRKYENKFSNGTYGTLKTIITEYTLEVEISLRHSVILNFPTRVQKDRVKTYSKREIWSCKTENVNNEIRETLDELLDTFIIDLYKANK